MPHLIHGCLLSLLTPTILAQTPPSPPGERLPQGFDQVQAELLKILKRQKTLNELERLTPAQTREVAYLRKRFLELSSLAMRMVQGPTKPRVSIEPAAPRPIGAAEEVLRKQADKLIRAASQRVARRRIAPAAQAVQLVRTILLDHPCLKALPSHRFYLAQFEASFADPRTKSRRNFIYQLVTFTIAKPTVEIHYGLGRSDPLEKLLTSGQVRAPDSRVATQLHTARAWLSQASRGARIFLPRPKAGMSRAELDHRFGLGRYAARDPIGPCRVIESKDLRILLSWRLRIDDFGMAPDLVFSWLRFASKGGRYLGRSSQRQGQLPKGTKIGDPRVRAMVQAFAKALED